jgi:hypothetical protein
MYYVVRNKAGIVFTTEDIDNLFDFLLSGHEAIGFSETSEGSDWLEYLYGRHKGGDNE